jgi:SNF2 family DNA or RNA helicase
VAGSVTVHRYYGSNKESDIDKLKEFDIVLTTYGTVMAKFSGEGCLYQIHWYRIILDEGIYD